VHVHAHVCTYGDGPSHLRRSFIQVKQMSIAHCHECCIQRTSNPAPCACLGNRARSQGTFRFVSSISPAYLHRIPRQLASPTPYTASATSQLRTSHQSTIATPMPSSARCTISLQDCTGALESSAASPRSLACVHCTWAHSSM
jgi:hypothetical protein